jgi:signal transduction histidine kinase/DNA-binding NarL/FixJ family response regulator
VTAGQGSIRSRLQRIVVVATLAALVCALVGNIVGNVLSFHRQHVADIAAQAELLGRMTAPALVFDDRKLASDNLGLFDMRSDIKAAAIYDAEGALFATYGFRGEHHAFPAAPETDAIHLRDGELVVFRQILGEGGVVGTVYLIEHYNLTALILIDVALAAAIGLLAMGIAFLMIRRMASRVTDPISAVAGTAREVVEQRDYSRRVEKTSDDEVGELVDSFNDMLVEVERRTQELETSYLEVRHEAEERKAAQQEVMRLNTSLERRVEERTAALQETNRALADAKSAADEANRAKSNFLATMSHEIRTPMNGVIGMIDVLHQTSLNGHQVEMVDLIRDSAFSLLTIIDDILDFSKIEAGRMDLEQEPMSLLAVVEGAGNLLDPFALRKEVELTVFVDPAIPRILLGDALRLRQVLVNLISNAIKFSSGRDLPGRVSVRAGLVACDAQRARVEIQVADNGIGIEPQALDRLFTAFSQADSSTTRRFGGTGLGLAICRHLVGLMDGELTVASTPGNGSTFRVGLELPLPAATPAMAAEPELAGIRCIVVGGPAGIGVDIAAYLADEGAETLRAPTLEDAPAQVDALSPGRCVCVVDNFELKASNNVLQLAATSLRGRDMRMVLIERGRSRGHGPDDTDIVLVEGNVLTRQRLVKAVAIAAGRALPSAPAFLGRHRADFEAPSRAEARRRGRLVLVAEDNETNQKVIVRQLALLGFAADVAPNGRAALELFQNGGYGLVLTDLHMPVMDGYELTTAIRAREGEAHHTPIVALTANALAGEAEHCRAIGMDDYLSKPLQLADLRQALEPLILPVATASDAIGATAVQDNIAVDINVLRSLVGNNQEVILELLEDFRYSASGIARDLIAACATGDVAATIAQAHKLKSSACTVGALPLGEICAQIEIAGKAGASDMLHVLLPAFEQAARAVDDFLADFLDSTLPAGANG